MTENKLKKILCSRFCVFLLLLAFVWLSLVLIKAVYKKHQLDQEIGALKTEIEKMDKKGQELTQLLNYFGSQDYLEKEAKEKLNLKKEGESVIMVPSSVIGQATSSESGAMSAVQKSETAIENNLIKWWKFFFK